MAQEGNKDMATDKELLEQAKKRAARAAELAAKRAELRNARAGEDKAAAFKRLGKARTNKALDAIATLRGLATKANYDYTPEQAAQIIKALRAGVDKVEADFSNGGPIRNSEAFTL